MTDSTPIPDHVLRVLRYVELVERGGVALSIVEIDRYADVEASPRVNMTIGAMTSLVSSNWFNMKQMQSIGEYFLQVGWLDRRSHLLTSTSRAILRATADRTEEPATSAVILSPTDPLNLAVLTREVAGAKGGLLLDPYLPFEYLAWLYESTSIVRLLIGRRDRRDELDSQNQASLRLALGGIARDNARRLEVRQLSRDLLHDRLLLSEDGDVYLIGASLNGLHKNVTAIVPISEPAATAYRDQVEEWWATAVRVEPQESLTRARDSNGPVGPAEDGATIA
jgi:hypothetical protein